MIERQNQLGVGMPDRVLILSASSGAGHVRAAQALEKAFRQTGAVKEVRHVDALQYASPIVRDIYSRGYINMVNKAPAVLGWLYDVSDKPFKNEMRRLAFDRLNTLPLTKLIVNYEADLIVTTHFLPAELVSWLLCRRRINASHSVVVTDFDAHAMWLCRHYDYYFVALEETRQYLRTLGVDSHSINVSGIPIDPIFAQPKSKAAMRAKYGLDPDRPTVIVLGRWFWGRAYGGTVSRAWPNGTADPNHRHVWQERTAAQALKCCIAREHRQIAN